MKCKADDGTLCRHHCPGKKCSDVGTTQCSIRQPASSPTETEKRTYTSESTEAVEHLQKCPTLKVDGVSHEAHCCFDLWCISCQGALSRIILWVQHQIRSDRIFCRKWRVLRNRGNGIWEGLWVHTMQCTAKSPHAVWLTDWLTEPRNVLTLGYEQTNHSAACCRMASLTKWTNRFHRSGGGQVELGRAYGFTRAPGNQVGWLETQFPLASHSDELESVEGITSLLGWWLTREASLQLRCGIAGCLCAFSCMRLLLL